MSNLSSPPNDPSLPSWLTDESSTVDSLLAEISRQSPKPAEEVHANRKYNDPQEGDSSTSFASVITNAFDFSKDKNNSSNQQKLTANNNDDENDEYKTDQRHQDQTSFLPDTTIKPISDLIRSQAVLRKFLHKFVIARKGRIDSAAERVLALCKLLEQYPHLTINYDLDIIRALNVNAMEQFPLKQCERHGGAVLMYLKPSVVDWDRIEVEKFEKMIFWLIFIISMMPNHAAQRNGCVLQIDGTDCGPSNIKMSFELFCMRLMSHCLPIRMVGMYCYNFGRFVRWVVWPPLKLAIPNKIIDRVFFVDYTDDIEKNVGAIDLHRIFGGEWRPSAVPSQSDLAFVLQWTTDGKAMLPQDIQAEIEKQEQGKDQRNEVKSGTLPEKRRVY